VVAWIDKYSRLSVGDDFGRGISVSRHDRNSMRHGIEKDEAEPLP
jgi:hypothetical protein